MEQRVRVLIVGGSPEPSSATLVGALAAQHDRVVAVDRGLDVLLEAGAGCDVFCGDADSVNERGAAEVRACEAGESSVVGAVERYNPHKDLTDLALAFEAIDSLWPGADVTCTCLTGGNPDHALAVYGRLASLPRGVSMREDEFSARIMHTGSAWMLEGVAGSRFSFVPLSLVAVVSESGMHWELDHKHVELLGDLGISNVIESERAVMTCHEGTIVAWCFEA